MIVSLNVCQNLLPFHVILGFIKLYFYFDILFFNQKLSGCLSVLNSSNYFQTNQVIFRNCLVEWLTLSWRSPLSYRNQSIDLRSKSMDWFLCDNGLRHERVKTSSGLPLEIQVIVLLSELQKFLLLIKGNKRFFDSTFIWDPKWT